MVRIIFIVVFSFYCCNTIAQVNNGKISGTVSDSLTNTILELATVSVFSKDSSLINYQLSDKNGGFAISKLPLNKELRLDVSFVGYNSHRQYFRLDSSTVSLQFKIGLTINLDDTNAVVVKSIVPIRMNGDTLEINPAAFKMEKTAVAEELLNQVPGIVIWADGSITVNGRPVPKILVDGKPFLSQGDHTVATQNLPKTAIEKIQLYQEVDRTKEQRDNTEQDSIYTMNIRLKENKKTGYFGKAGAGYGTDQRYEGDASIQAYNKTNRLSFGAGINNINKNVGSVQQMLGNNTFRKMNPNIFNVSSFGRNGINKSYSLGTLYSHDFVYSENGNRYNTINANYTHNGSDNLVSTKTIQERTTANFSQTIESTGNTNSNNTGHSAGLSYGKSNNPSRNFNMFVQANLNNNHSFNNNYTSVKDSSLALQSTNDVKSETRTRSQSGSFGLSLTNFNPEKPLSKFSLSVSAGFSGNISERNARSFFDSYTDPAADTGYNRMYNSDNESGSFNLNFNYSGLRRLIFRRFNLFNILLHTNHTVSYEYNKSNITVNDFDSSTDKFLQNTNLSNNNKVQSVRYTPSLIFQKSINRRNGRSNKNISFNLRLAQSLQKEMNNSSIVYRNVDRRFSFFTPSFNVSYNYGLRDKFAYNLSAGFNRNYSYPTIDQLYTITDSINLYNIRFGNPDLKNSGTDNFNFKFNINKRKPKARYEIGGHMSANLSYRNNPVADSIINDLSGKRLMYYINAANGIDFSLNYGMNIARKFGKSSFQLQYGGSNNRNSSSNFIDGIASNNRSNNFSHNFSLQYSIKTKLILSLTESVNTHTSGQSGSGLSSFKVTNTSTQFGATLNLSKDLSFNSTISTTDNSNISSNIVLWHAYASYRFLKGKQGELKFSAFDLLKKFQNINVNTTIDGTSTTVNNGLRQFCLLTFSYYPRKFGKGNDDN